MDQAILALMTIVIGVAAVSATSGCRTCFLDKVMFPARGPKAGRNINRANLGAALAFPVSRGLRAGALSGLSGVRDPLAVAEPERVGRAGFVGLDNYRRCVGEAKFWESLRNNMVWLIVVPAASTAFGLLAAQLTDRIRWGNLAKSMIFMPMAISFVGASVIWKLIYDTREAGSRRSAF